MKRNLLYGVAIAVSFGVAAPAMAQFDIRHPASSYQYSSYGYRQDEAQEVSPSDRVVPAPIPDTAPPATELSTGPIDAPYADCDSGSVYHSVVGGKLGHGGIGGGYIGAPRSATRNWVFGVRGLLFGRDYEDDRGLGSNIAGDSLFSTEADHGAMGGFETYLGVRNCSGWGWQLGYWGLYPTQADYTFNGPGLSNAVFWAGDLAFGGNCVCDIFNFGDDWRIYRDTTVHNLEWNILRNGGSARGFCGRQVNIEWLCGFRWFHFEEAFRWGTFTTAGGFPPQLFYDLSARNNLLGFQFGSRTEHCLSNRLSFSIGTKVGVYNNDIKHRQAIHDGAGNFATINLGPFAGQDYNFESRKDDVSVLGELDLGLNYRLSKCWRANVGWRLLGVSGVALAVDQIPNDFIDVNHINRVNSNGSLILHGAYFGLERAF